MSSGLEPAPHPPRHRPCKVYPLASSCFAVGLRAVLAEETVDATRTIFLDINEDTANMATEVPLRFPCLACWRSLASRISQPSHHAVAQCAQREPPLRSLAPPCAPLRPLASPCVGHCARHISLLPALYHSRDFTGRMGG